MNTLSQPLDLTKLARGEACTNCGHIGDDVVLAHFSGLRQHAFGKGRGRKCDHWYGAPQCMRCHADGPFAEGWIDPATEGESRFAQRLAKSEAQLFQVLQWHKSLAERGILVKCRS